MPAVWLNQYCVERFGRRVMLLVSCSLVCVVLFVVGGAGTATDKTMSLDQVIVAMVYIFMVVFNLALGPAVWVVTSEISTGPNRSKLMATSTGTNWFFSWVVTFTFPYLFNADGANLSARVGFIYGGLMFGAAVWIYFFLPETAGRSLEDIQVMFENGVPARKFKCESNVLAQTVWSLIVYPAYEIPQTTRLAVLEDEKEVRATEMESV